MTPPPPITSGAFFWPGHGVPIDGPSRDDGQGRQPRQSLGGDPLGSHLTLAHCSMSRLLIARAVNAGGIMAGTIAGHLSLLGILGVIVTTPSFCPRHPVDAALCRSTATKAAGLASQGLITAGVAGLMIAGARAIDPEV